MNVKTVRSHKQKRTVNSKKGYGYNGYSAVNHYMKCGRCGGSMVFERFMAAVEVFHAWRCVNCGEILDPVVEKNRRLVVSRQAG